MTIRVRFNSRYSSNKRSLSSKSSGMIDSSGDTSGKEEVTTIATPNFQTTPTMKPITINNSPSVGEMLEGGETLYTSSIVGAEAAVKLRGNYSANNGGDGDISIASATVTNNLVEGKGSPSDSQDFTDGDINGDIKVGNGVLKGGMSEDSAEPPDNSSASSPERSIPKKEDPSPLRDQSPLH